MRLPLSRTISNQELGDVFAFIGEVLAMQKANLFRVRAYQNAAVAIEQQTLPLSKMFLESPDFDRVPGIGEGMNALLVELFTTGDIKDFQMTVKDIPESVYALCRVPGLGAKRATVLAKEFHLETAVTAVADLLAVAKKGKIRGLPG